MWLSAHLQEARLTCSVFRKGPQVCTLPSRACVRGQGGSGLPAKVPNWTDCAAYAWACLRALGAGGERPRACAQMGLHLRADGSVDTSAFKIVYVAPMKALVAEMVGNFSERLKEYNMQARAGPRSSAGRARGAPPACYGRPYLLYVLNKLRLCLQRLEVQYTGVDIVKCGQRQHIALAGS
jgi:hypothetical protein